MTGRLTSSGYSHPEYAWSLSDVGDLVWLEHCRGWIIKRPVGDSGLMDAMGLYPFFSCGNLGALSADFEKLRIMGLVSLVLITDPLLSDSERISLTDFSFQREFKINYISDLDIPIKNLVSKHHAYYSRRAARHLQVEVVNEPLKFLDEWCALYSELVAKYKIGDLRRFSRNSFATLLAMPGLVVFKAVLNGEAVGAQIVLTQGDVAIAHLAAFTGTGYTLGASYLLDWQLITHFKGRARYVNWGGGLEEIGGQDDGLARYKAGWSSMTRRSYVIGKVFDQGAYDLLNEAVGLHHVGLYFPAYRWGEFTTKGT